MDTRAESLQGFVRALLREVPRHFVPAATFEPARLAPDIYKTCALLSRFSHGVNPLDSFWEQPIEGSDFKRLTFPLAPVQRAVLQNLFSQRPRPLVLTFPMEHRRPREAQKHPVPETIRGHHNRPACLEKRDEGGTARLEGDIAFPVGILPPDDAALRVVGFNFWISMVY